LELIKSLQRDTLHNCNWSFVCQS